MSAVAMVVLSRGESRALDTNCAQLYARAVAAMDEEVLGLSTNAAERVFKNCACEQGTGVFGAW